MMVDEIMSGAYSEFVSKNEEVNDVKTDMCSLLWDNANKKCIEGLTKNLQYQSDNGLLRYVVKCSYTDVVLNHFREKGIKIVVKNKFNIFDGRYTVTTFSWGDTSKG